MSWLRVVLMLFFLTPSFYSRPLVITVLVSELPEQYATAAQMALDRLHLNDSVVQVNVVDSKSNCKNQVVPLIPQKDKIDVLVVEPKCREVAFKAADFASEWPVPVASPIRSKRTECNRSLIMLSIEYKTYELFVRKLFDHSKWNRAAFLFSPLMSTCLTEAELRRWLKTSMDLGYSDTGQMYSINIQLPGKNLSERLPLSENVLGIRMESTPRDQMIREQIKKKVEFLSEANYTKLIQVYDAVSLYASVLTEHHKDSNTTLEVLERLLTKCSSKPSSTEEVPVSHERPCLELQVVTDETNVPKVVLVLGGDSGDKLLQLGHMNWIEGHAPDDQLQPDPDLPQRAVVLGALAAFLMVLIVAFLLIHRWIKANTIVNGLPDEENLEDFQKDPPQENQNYNYFSASPSHVWRQETGVQQVSKFFYSSMKFRTVTNAVRCNLPTDTPAQQFDIDSSVAESIDNKEYSDGDSLDSTQEVPAAFSMGK